MVIVDTEVEVVIEVNIINNNSNNMAIIHRNMEVQLHEEVLVVVLVVGDVPERLRPSSEVCRGAAIHAVVAAHGHRHPWSRAVQRRAEAFD